MDKEEFSVGISSGEQVALLTDYDADSAYSVAYHKLYANIRVNWDSEQSRQLTILFATPTTYTGQAAVAANVAIIAAQNGTPAIVVDADLHASSLQQRFGVGDNIGLSELLAAKTINTQIVEAHLSSTFVPGLRLLSAGKTRVQDVTLLPTAKLGSVING